MSTPFRARGTLVGSLVLLGLSTPPATAAPPAAPADADLAGILREHDEDVGRLETRYRTAREQRVERTIARLKELQDEHCRRARLDEALAVREEIRRLARESAALAQPVVAAPAAPEWLSRLPVEPGQSLQFTVTGDSRGPVWGTDVYTIDSRLPAAAVHAGLLAVGETGVVTVRIVESPAEHAASTRHGVTSGRWGSYRASYRLERAGVPPAQVPAPSEPETPAGASAPVIPATPPSPATPAPPTPPAAARLVPRGASPPPPAEAPLGEAPRRRPFD